MAGETYQNGSRSDDGWEKLLNMERCKTRKTRDIDPLSHTFWTAGS